MYGIIFLLFTLSICLQAGVQTICRYQQLKYYCTTEYVEILNPKPQRREGGRCPTHEAVKWPQNKTHRNVRQSGAHGAHTLIVRQNWRTRSRDMVGVTPWCESPGPGLAPLLHYPKGAREGASPNPYYSVIVYLYKQTRSLKCKYDGQRK